MIARCLLSLFWVVALLAGLALGVQAGDDAAPGDVVINEFLADPSGISDGDGEWIELHNTTGSPIDINGWLLDGHTIDNGGSLVIPAQGKVLICRNEDVAANGGLACDYRAPLSLANGGDTIRLTEDVGELEVIAVITYTDQLVGDGQSAFYIPAANPPAAGYFGDNGDLQRWRLTEVAATNLYTTANYGTPGTVNGQSAATPIPTAIVLTHFATRSTGLVPRGGWFLAAAALPGLVLLVLVWRRVLDRAA